jgi:beta-glucuronidase
MKTGVRSIKVTSDGRLVLNGAFLAFRGVGFHEDTKERGFAITNADREFLVREAKALGSTMMRTHYPPHPYLHELADRLGMMLWSEIPVYSVKTQYLARPTVRKLAAKELERNITTFWNHPSVVIWSIGNELSSRPGPVQADYIRRARDLARSLDPTRPVGLAVAGYPQAGCQPEYAPLDVIGFNDYFGWYPGPSGLIFDRTKLSGYLDSLRACYPDKAIVMTEFGAEANRDGPVEEKGTWAFQQDFVNYHLSVYATKPWLSGALYWALNEFRVRPSWDGGNPRPNPPIHQKGLLTYDRVRKPAWNDVHKWFTGQHQYVVPAGRNR